jgi:5-methyltetrahydrofolate--homocysteine methyltransferase
VIIGGAPVTQAYCDAIGADGYSADAASAADLARRLIA